MKLSMDIIRGCHDCHFRVFNLMYSIEVKETNLCMLYVVSLSYPKSEKRRKISSMELMQCLHVVCSITILSKIRKKEENIFHGVNAVFGRSNEFAWLNCCLFVSTQQRYLI
jgi:hypothetical protein